MTLPYRLPDGTIAQCDATATKGECSIGFTLAGGAIVTARRADELIENPALDACYALVDLGDEKLMLELARLAIHRAEGRT